MSKKVRYLASIGAAVVVISAPAFGQSGGFPWNLFGGTTGSVPAQAAPPAPAAPAAPGVPASPPEWSGESGSSGHPTMAASAIRAAAANFRQCVSDLYPLAAQRGVTRPVFDAHTASLTPDLRIMDLMVAQPEFSKAIWEYLDLLVSEARIAGGRAILSRHKAHFDAVEKHYGVDRHVIAAIWG